MARTQGPLFSQDASGTVGKLITHSHWKGRTYAKRSSTPTNPNSPEQLSVRAMMGWLNGQWSNPLMTAAVKDAWAAYDAGEVLPPLNKFLRVNLERWTQYLAPLLKPPPAIFDTNPTFNQQANAVGGIRKVTITWDIATLNQCWAMAVFRSLVTGFAPGHANLVAVHRVNTTVLTTVFDAPLDPGTYFYRHRSWTTGGRANDSGTQRTAIVTN